MSDFKSVVANGMSFLDAEKPGWRSELNLSRLNVASCDVCVLGQLFGDYDDGLTELGIDNTEAKRYGFNTDGDMSALTAAWKEALGKENTLVEKGDIYRDSYGCCAIRVEATKMVTLNGEPVTIYVAAEGSIVDNSFKAHTPASDNLRVLRRDEIGEGSTFHTKVVKVVQGMFIEDAQGTVYYMVTNATARPIKDKSESVYFSTLKGVKELTLKNGDNFSKLIK